jgi:hypothetical protein
MVRKNEKSLAKHKRNKNFGSGGWREQPDGRVGRRSSAAYWLPADLSWLKAECSQICHEHQQTSETVGTPDNAKLFRLLSLMVSPVSSGRVMVLARVGFLSSSVMKAPLGMEFLAMRAT